MSEQRNEVLQAEEKIRELAQELEKAKTINESVANVERRLNEAATALEQSRKALEDARAAMQGTTTQAHTALNEAIRALNQASQQIKAQDVKMQRLSKRLLACLVLISVVGIASLITIALLLLKVA